MAKILIDVDALKRAFLAAFRRNIAGLHPNTAALAAFEEGLAEVSPETDERLRERIAARVAIEHGDDLDALARRVGLVRKNVG